jgi:hypothetical protein
MLDLIVCLGFLAMIFSPCAVAAFYAGDRRFRRRALAGRYTVADRKNCR